MIDDPRVIRSIIAIIFPPLAVLERGCGTALMVGVLTLFFWFPGMIAALVLIWIESPDAEDDGPPRRYIHLAKPKREEKQKRKSDFVHLADGDIVEVVEEDPH